MPPIIKILPDHVVNKIAAGEVVERPASVVKELVENAIDASATEIFVDIEQAGRRLIRVVDNGCGMPRDDARIAFERHATSKITSDSDLEAVRTMGFRGEALSSIASVAHIRLVTGTGGAQPGTLIEIEGGKVKTAADAAAPRGTALDVAHLFFNTPARLKFLKSPTTEFAHIVAALSRQALAHPTIRFKLVHNGKGVLDLPASQDLLDRAFQLYGKEIVENLAAFSGGTETVQVSGLLGKPGYSRADKTYQDFYVNRRAVRNASLSHALSAGYADMLMRDRHPVAFIFITIAPGLVDVNVHPAKTEVRFRNQSQIHDLVRDAVRAGLGGRQAGPLNAGPGSVRKDASYYLQNAEYGVRSAESNAVFSSIPVRERPGIHQESGPETSSHGLFHSALDTPNSAFLTPLAQVHDSFIIAQSSSGLAIIDQHAAHERVLFELLQDQFGNGKMELQDLLISVQVEPGPAQGSLLSERLDELAGLGFIVEDFGSGTFIIKAVPSLLAGADYKQLLLDILDELVAHGQSRRLDSANTEVLSMMACHPAVKVHRKLERSEMEALLNDLSRCRMPHTCPHGRPTIVSISIEDLKKMFKRT